MSNATETKLVRVSNGTHASLKTLMHRFEFSSRKEMVALLVSFASSDAGLASLRQHQGN